MKKFAITLISLTLIAIGQIAFGNQLEIKNDICREGLGCWIQYCPNDAILITPISQRRMNFIKAGYQVSEIVVSKSNSSLCGFEYKFSENVDVAKSESSANSMSSTLLNACDLDVQKSQSDASDSEKVVEKSIAQIKYEKCGKLYRCLGNIWSGTEKGKPYGPTLERYNANCNL